MHSSRGQGASGWSRRMLIPCGLFVVLLAGISSGLFWHLPATPVAQAAPDAGEELADGKLPRQLSPDEALALRLLDEAANVAEAKLRGADAESAFCLIASTAAFVDGPAGVKWIRRLSERAAQDPATTFGSHAWLASLAAPHDRTLRDQYLKRAVSAARAALAKPELWIAPPAPPGQIPFGDPQQNRDWEKALLTLQVELWEQIIGSQDPVASGIKVRKLLADPRTEMVLETCIHPTVHGSLLSDLASLDARLLLEYLVATWPEKRLAEHCAGLACRRNLERQHDQFTRLYVTYAVTHGIASTDTLNIYKEYDFADAWKRAIANSPVQRSMIADFAWRDPDAALQVAEAETDVDLRRDLIDLVSRVWAQKRPEQVERAIKNQDNAVRQGWARAMAAEELARRKQGLGPGPRRERPQQTWHCWNKRELTAAESLRRKEFRKRASAEVNRVLDNPEKTDWLAGAERQRVLQQAAWQAYFETLEFETFDKIVASLRDEQEIDALLVSCSGQIGQWGDASHLAIVLKQIRSPSLFVSATADAARSLVRR